MTYFNDEIEEEKNEQLTPEEEIVVEEAESNLQTVKPTDNKKDKKDKVKKAGKAKATVSELKKVTWPTFGKVVKQTLVVLSVTFVFLLVVIGIDQLLYLLYNLLTKNM
ncbi:MAG: preprotein translocase subunit SecE [Eubacteriales bacterium]|nr:preprotein translocase subunit SecE [Clostridia bacterium]MDY2696076.1 preprotein translocase subunit SecE [Eubacteriales bacterium]